MIPVTSAAGERRARDPAHQAVAATAIDEADSLVAETASERLGRLAEAGSSPWLEPQ